MSFLLDALGKADDDRQRAAVPELRTPRHQRNTPTRRVFKVVLWLSLMLVSFALGFFSRPYLEPGYTISIVRDDANVSAQSQAGDKTTAAESLNVVAGGSAQPVPPTAVSPVIELSVISYSSVPTERFAMLNGFLMYEGDVLSGGERLIEIKTDGVLLEKDGRQYSFGLAIAPRD